MLNKRWITLPVVYCRPFASKAVFWSDLLFWVRRLLFLIIEGILETVKGKLKILQNSLKTAFEGKGLQCTTSKVIQSLFNIDLYTHLAWRYITMGEANGEYINYKITSVKTHRLCGIPVL